MAESSKVKAWAAKHGVKLETKQNSESEAFVIKLDAPTGKCFVNNDQHSLVIRGDKAASAWKDALGDIRQGLDNCSVVCDCRVVPTPSASVPSLATGNVAEGGANSGTINREQWLTLLAGKLRPLVELAGGTLPPSFKLACGWPSKGALSAKQRRIGECWSPVASAEGVTEMFISPSLYEPLHVAETVVHELIHATGAFKHTGSFKKLALAVGLTGKMTSTVAGEELKAKLAAIVATLPPYPHSMLTALKGNQKKEGTRLLKVACDTCGYTIRVTQKWIAVGYPTCPCGDVMGGENEAERNDEERSDEEPN